MLFSIATKSGIDLKITPGRQQILLILKLDGMKIDKVTYNTSFVTGPYLQDKIGFEATLEKGDTPKKALTELKKIAEEWQKENIAPVAESAKLGEIQVRGNVSDEQIESDILNSKDLTELRTYLQFVEYNTRFSRAYNIRAAQLNNKTNHKKVVLP